MTSAPTRMDHIMANRAIRRAAGVKRTVYSWAPREDITAYELALCYETLLFIAAGRGDGVSKQIERLPEIARRHWRSV